MKLLLRRWNLLTAILKNNQSKKCLKIYLMNSHDH